MTIKGNITESLIELNYINYFNQLPEEITLT